MEIQRGGVAMTYAHYYELVYARAREVDTQVMQTNKRSSRRSANQHEMEHVNFLEEDYFSYESTGLGFHKKTCP